jgi:peroxiredoxin
LPTNSKKVHSRHRVLEAIILAFVGGFAVVRYLPFYHEQHRLLREEAVAQTEVQSSVSNQRTARLTTSKMKSYISLPATPATIAHVSAPRVPKLTTVAVDDNKLAGGVALTRLISGCGTDAGRQAPSLSLPNLNGTEVSLDAMRGKVVLLNFWATWCGPCRSEMPSLERLYHDFSTYPDFALLTVNVDQDGKRSVERFMAKNGYDFPVLLDAEDVATSAYGVSGFPTTFVIGRNGRIVWNCAGALNWSDASLRNALKKLLEKTPPRSIGTLQVRLNDPHAAQQLFLPRLQQKRIFRPLPQALELAARPPNQEDIDPTKRRIHCRLVEMTVVVDPAADVRLNIRARSSSAAGRPAAV